MGRIIGPAQLRGAPHEQHQRADARLHFRQGDRGYDRVLSEGWQEMTVRHTPGPWRTTANWNIVTDVNEARPTLIASALFGGYQPSELERAEVKANATLISAAPDLLSVCELALQFATPISGLADKLRAAIAKARGES